MLTSGDRAARSLAAAICGGVVACGGIALDTDGGDGGAGAVDVPTGDAGAAALPAAGRSSGGSAAGDGCDTLLTPGDPGEACVDDRRCDQARANPDDAYAFLLLIEPDDSVRDCIAARLEARGLEVSVPLGAGRLYVVGTYSELAPTLGLAQVLSYEIDCLDVPCPHCDDLSVEACAEDAFCSVLRGQRWSSEGCYEAWAPAGCHGVRGCGDEVTSAQDPEGACWTFPDTCIPAGWHEVKDGSYCPGVHAYDPQPCTP